MGRQRNLFTFNKMNYIQISEWVEKVIRSCKNNEQLKSAEKLFQTYKKQTNKETYHYIHRYLTHLLQEKHNDINYRQR